MRRTPRLLRVFLPIIALALAGSTTGIVFATPAASPAGEPADLFSEEPFVQVTGVGETILIVVGGDFGSLAEAEAARATAQLTFGHLQGFYIDEADNYQVVGVYEQTSADQRVVPCADWKRQTRMECPPGISHVKAYQDVALRHIALAGARSFLSANDQSGCGSPGSGPCARANLARLLTPALTLRPGRFLLLNAYRTKQGAADGVDFARTAVPRVSVLRVRKIGGGYVGLGQEGHPDGTGPLNGPLADPATHQE